MVTGESERAEFKLLCSLGWWAAHRGLKLTVVSSLKVTTNKTKLEDKILL